MIIQPGSLIEIKPVNPHITQREFVSAHQVARIYQSDWNGPGNWSALLTDGSVVSLKDGPEEVKPDG